MNNHLPPDFSNWSLQTLVKLAHDLWEDNKRLREENKALLDTWRKEVARSANEPQ
jgi:hypothetical protein